MVKLRSEAIIQKSQFIKSSECMSGLSLSRSRSHLLSLTPRVSFLPALLVISLEAKSRYAIIPTTFSPGNEAQFTLTIFSEHDVRLRQLKDPTELSIEVPRPYFELAGSLERERERALLTHA